MDNATGNFENSVVSCIGLRVYLRGVVARGNGKHPFSPVNPNDTTSPKPSFHIEHLPNLLPAVSSFLIFFICYQKKKRCWSKVDLFSLF